LEISGPSESSEYQSAVSAGTEPEERGLAIPDLLILSSKTAAFFTALWRTRGELAGKIGICSWKPAFSNTWFDITEAGIKAAAARAIALGGGTMSISIAPRTIH
jgi:hypothetical protein